MDLHRRIRHDLLNRLRWDVLAPISSITILCAPYEENIYLPFFSHPAADVSLASPPLSRISAYSRDISMREDLDMEADEEDQYKGPANLSINNHDNPITMRQFVTEVHEYLNREDVMSVIKETKAIFYGTPRADGTGRDCVYEHLVTLPEDVEFWFWLGLMSELDGVVTVALNLFLEGEMMRTKKAFWALTVRKVKEYEVPGSGGFKPLVPWPASTPLQLGEPGLPPPPPPPPQLGQRGRSFTGVGGFLERET
jgi:hypothetical protein